MHLVAALVLTVVAAMTPAEQLAIGENYTQMGKPKQAIPLLHKALKGALSLRQSEGAVSVAEALTLEEPRTRALRAALSDLGVEGDSILIVLAVVKIYLIYALSGLTPHISGVLLLAGSFDARSILLTVLVSIWALRLGGFLFLRIRRAGKDARFDQMKRSFALFLRDMMRERGIKARFVRGGSTQYLVDMLEEGLTDYILDGQTFDLDAVRSIAERVKAGELEPGKELPTCEDCHTSHTISRTDRDDFRMLMMSQCGRCHEDESETFFETYHGKVTRLGYGMTAKCSDGRLAHGHDARIAVDFGLLGEGVNDPVDVLAAEAVLPKPEPASSEPAADETQSREPLRHLGQMIF